MAEDQKNGHETLETIWWDIMDELHEIAVFGEGIPNRIAAADTILRYISTLNQGINAPFVPVTRPEPEDDDDE